MNHKMHESKQRDYVSLSNAWHFWQLFCVMKFDDFDDLQQIINLSPINFTI